MKKFNIGMIQNYNKANKNNLLRLVRGLNAMSISPKVLSIIEEDINTDNIPNIIIYLQEAFADEAISYEDYKALDYLFNLVLK